MTRFDWTMIAGAIWVSALIVHFAPFAGWATP